MSFATSKVTEQIPVPKTIEQKVIDIAIDYGIISKSEGTFLSDNNAAQQCVDAFVSSGFNPSAVVDKLAEFGVSSGKFKTKEACKKQMKSTIEKERKKESNWTKLYRLLNL